MYKLDFTLKQHTPIIHFQHDQDGATLRASEVKPKLDRFISSQYISENDEDRKIINKFKTNLDKKISNYKIRIYTNDNIEYFLPLANNLNSDTYPNKEKNVSNYLKDIINFDWSFLNPTAYFANSDKIKFVQKTEEVDNIKIEEVRFAVKAIDELKMTIICFDQEICNLLVKIIPEFILIENYGTRQNKGFGSYTVTKINNIDSSININEILNKYFKAVYKKNTRKWSETIVKDYKELKAGKGRQEGYKKSILFNFFANEVNPPIRWEKRFMKRSINGKVINGRTFNLKPIPITSTNSPIDYNNIQTWEDEVDSEGRPIIYGYIRALLGLAEKYEFAASPENLFVDITSSNIERYKSPIFFKVIDDLIYLCANDIEQDHPILNASFNMKYHIKNSKKEEFIDILDTPKVPNHFSLIDFLEYALIKGPSNIKLSGYTKI